ncbi:MAG: hypothetical protein H7A51_13435 [Akkermansiaceae bacterium]|nr:hypothetical protein [Akkermansiaceae bacterium]
MKMTVTHHWKFVISIVLMMLYLSQLLRYWHQHGFNLLVVFGIIILVGGGISAFKKMKVTWQIDNCSGVVKIQKDSKTLFSGTEDDLREVREDACDVFLYTRDRTHIQIPKDAMNDVLRDIVMKKNVAEQGASSDR